MTDLTPEEISNMTQLIKKLTELSELAAEAIQKFGSEITKAWPVFWDKIPENVKEEIKKSKGSKVEYR
jgi:hypothetical protein